VSDKVDISGRIAIEDTASPVVKKIEASIASIGKAASKVGGSFTKVANMGALGGVAKNAKAAASAVGGLGRSLFKIAAPIAALAGAAGFGGVAYEMQRYITTTDELAKSARNVGVTVEELQQLRHVAKLSGIEAEELDGGLRKLNKTMGDAARGKNKSFAALMQRLGISMKDAAGQTRTAAQVMPQLANAIKNNTNHIARNDIVTAAFGKTGAKWIAMLEQGKISMEELMAEMIKYGQISTAEAEAAEQAANAQHRFSTALTGVRNTIAAALLPALTPVIEHMSEWVAVNRLWLSQNIEKFIEGFAAGMKQIPWQTIGTALKDMAAGFGEVWTAIGGFKTVIPALAAILAGVLLSSIWGVVAALGKLAVALATNPVFLVIAAIGLLAFEIWRNWEDISAAFEWAKETIAATWERLMQGFRELGAEFAKIPGALMEGWGIVAGFFTDLWGDIAGVFWTAVDWLDEVVGLFVPGGLTAAWNAVASFYADWWQFNKDAFWIAVDWLDRFVGLFIPGGLTTAWSGVKDFFKSMWDGIVAIFEGAWKLIKPIIDPLIWAGEKIASLFGKGGTAAAATGEVKNLSAAAQYGGGAQAKNLTAAAQYGGGTAAVLPASSLYGGVAEQGPVAREAQAAQAQPVRVDGEVDARIKVDLAPGLVGTATSKDNGKVHSRVEVGHSMVPA